MSTAPMSGAEPARSSTRRRRRWAIGTPLVWIPTRATRERAGLATSMSCAIGESVRRIASASSRILPAGASTALTTQAGSTGCGQAGASDSFPASLDRVKGVRLRGTLDASPDGVPEARPLPCVEVARTGSPVEAELAGAAFQQAILLLGLADDVFGLGHRLDRILRFFDRVFRNRDRHRVVFAVADLGVDPRRAENPLDLFGLRDVAGDRDLDHVRHSCADDTASGSRRWSAPPLTS